MLVEWAMIRTRLKLEITKEKIYNNIRLCEKGKLGKMKHFCQSMILNRLKKVH